MGTAVPSGRVAVTGAADRFTVCWPNAAALARRRAEAASADLIRPDLLFLTDRICGLLPYRDSSITNSRESTSIIISMPPGNMLLVVISRSLCECHMKAKPASDDGGFAIVPEGGVVPVGPVARTVAFGPR